MFYVNTEILIKEILVLKSIFKICKKKKQEQIRQKVVLFISGPVFVLSSLIKKNY